MAGWRNVFQAGRLTFSLRLLRLESNDIDLLEETSNAFILCSMVTKTHEYHKDGETNASSPRTAV